jgi:hypothetical protein
LLIPTAWNGYRAGICKDILPALLLTYLIGVSLKIPNTGQVELVSDKILLWV